MTVAVDAQLTPELHAEGLAARGGTPGAGIRKDAGFNIEDRITTFYVASGEMAQVLQTWSEYIIAEP